MRVSLFLIFVMMATATEAADLSVEVLDNKGRAVRDAVVSLAPQFEPIGDLPKIERAEMRQEDTMFSPFILPVHVGAVVSFPNFDEFRHQVYSFSKTKRFELRLYGQDESKSVTFDQPGVVALGCNIHDNMLAYIYVSENPIVAKTDGNGRVTLNGIEPGMYDIYVWHPDMRSGNEKKEEAVAVSEATAEVSVSVELRSFRSIQHPPSEDEYN